jgi:hypothetical protein
MSPDAQNMKIGVDALATAENESGSAKLKNGTRRPQYHGIRFQESKTFKRYLAPSFPPKTSPGAQNMKMGPDARGTAENESGSTNLENRT